MKKTPCNTQTQALALKIDKAEIEMKIPINGTVETKTLLSDQTERKNENEIKTEERKRITKDFVRNNNRKYSRKKKRNKLYYQQFKTVLEILLIWKCDVFNFIIISKH